MTISNLIFGQKRAKIGNITIDATVSERHQNNAQATDNPVEDSADITDHVRIMPKQLQIDGVISDTPLTLAVISNISGVIGTVLERTTGKSLSKENYDAIVKLQEKREPIKVVTGLKVYENMIIESFDVPRTAQTANAIHFSMSLKEIQIAKSKTVSTLSVDDSVSSTASPTTDLGSKVSDKVSASSPIASGNNVTTLGTQQASGSTGFFNVMDSLRGVL